MIDTDALRAGNRRALARAITLIESSREEDRTAAQELLAELLLDTGKSIRLGISGVPGVGKSTFIEAFGVYLAKRGRRVAVLAVDPSSPIHGGSILGDKTRMSELSRLDNAYIRPSPTSGAIGGIAEKTRETILLCEAAGFDVILIETVGVGQSEYDVAAMVDCFMLLVVPNAGDELQGIKRGITELTDILVVNKADGNAVAQAEQTKRYYENAFHILHSSGGWQPRVLTCSALEKTQLADVWDTLQTYLAETADTLDARRAGQNVDWMRHLIQDMLLDKLTRSEAAQNRLPDLEDGVRRGDFTPYAAAAEVLDLLDR
ncbi:MAG: methylmalonyl Co-A mutase-associated GTPase MeaB [Gammaproteobacteria bacterium]|nr:methylmalonyl Co-A mutase-associated GTPase MeaB [Gammaproteobacteria bacterium]